MSCRFCGHATVYYAGVCWVCYYTLECELCNAVVSNTHAYSKHGKTLCENCFLGRGGVSWLKEGF